MKSKVNDRARGTSPAELRSSGPKQRPDKGSDEARRGKGRVPDVVSPTTIWINEDAEYCAYLAKFFKGEK